MSKQSLLVCPFCGVLQDTSEDEVCGVCSRLIGRSTLVVAENEMGPWWIRREKYPFRPGMTYDHIADYARNGKIDERTIIRGPTTKQLWDIAGRVKGIAHLMGRCHACGVKVDPSSRSCTACSADFFVYRDRNNLGLDQNEPSEGEVDGVSCFVTDESIFETQSTPMRVLAHSSTPTEKEESIIGSPQFRSVQRLLELSNRKIKVLIISLAISVVILGILIVLLIKN